MLSKLFRKKSIESIQAQYDEQQRTGQGLQRILGVRDLTFLGIAAVGYMNARLNIFERIICMAVAFLLIAAIPLTDELGFALMFLFIIYRWFKFRNNNSISA